MSESWKGQPEYCVDHEVNRWGDSIIRLIIDHNGYEFNDIQARHLADCLVYHMKKAGIMSEEAHIDD